LEGGGGRIALSRVPLIGLERHIELHEQVSMDFRSGPRVLHYLGAWLCWKPIFLGQMSRLEHSRLERSTLTLENVDGAFHALELFD
jgi:hypothetical protein